MKEAIVFMDNVLKTAREFSSWIVWILLTSSVMLLGAPFDIWAHALPSGILGIVLILVAASWTKGWGVFRFILLCPGVILILENQVAFLDWIFPDC